MRRERRPPADFNLLDALEDWVRAELAILWAESAPGEGDDAREEALSDVLSRLSTLRSRERAVTPSA